MSHRLRNKTNLGRYLLQVLRKKYKTDHHLKKYPPKGSSDPSHFIFEINVGKGRIRHRTTLKFNF